MTFDQTTRNRLARFVSDARTLLIDEFTRQCQNEYGLDPSTGDVTDMATLGQLDDSRRATAQWLRDTLAHYLATADTSTTAKAKKARREALDRIVREQAFTILNRLCALAMAEARQLLLESVACGYQSQGFQLYSRLAGTALGETGDAYRSYLFSVFDELAVDLPVLFDRFSPQGRLFPRESVLLALLDRINHPDLETLWPEDETIGWIYQYFNSVEERRQMRAESQAPRNSRELAVRNQFFTPRYVVEFLTDNTLGRIWYEMTQGQTSLVEHCRYLVRRPDEVLLGAKTEGVGSRFRETALPHGESSPENDSRPLSPATEAEPTPVGRTSLSDNTADGQECPSFQIVAENDSRPRWPDGPAEMARLLHEGTAADWPQFDRSDESVQAMIALGHTVDGYARHADADAWQRWFPEISQTLCDESLTDLTTQDLLDGLFLICRNDRHGGDGSVYREPWFIGACNEVRRRALKSREPDLSQEELLRQPVFIPYRPLKDPRDIKMLDPACGSMHFGLYAFDLFERIYEEYFENVSGQLAVGSGDASDEPYQSAPTTNKEPRTTNEEPPPTDYPHLIIERNIHGIDIDPRAVQIAGLSLWLRAQRSWHERGIKAAERPRIERSNVVCAEPMPGDERLLDEFLKSLRRDRLEGLIRRVLDVPETQQVRATERMAEALCGLVRTVWNEMKLAGEAGSLLKIEESLREAIEAGKEEWEEKLPLFRITEFGLDGQAEKTQYLRSIAGQDEDFWSRAEPIVLAALQAYAEQAENGRGFQRRLFASDAARGFAFIDLCRNQYDVALLNPPFCQACVSCRPYLNQCYPEGKPDILCAFIQRVQQLGTPSTVIGVLSNRSVFYGKLLGPWRSKCAYSTHRLRLFADLGLGVLDDALVEAAAYTIASGSREPALFIRLLEVLDKQVALNEKISNLQSHATYDGVTSVPVDEFVRIPDGRLAYWTSRVWRQLFQQILPFEEGYGPVKDGPTPGDDFRFLRCVWEVPVGSIGLTARWIPIAKGGEYSPFYAMPHLVFDWRGGHSPASAYTKAVLRNIGFFGTPGLTYTERTTSSLSVRVLPSDCGFTTVGQTMFPRVPRDALVALGLWMSQPAQRLVEMCVGAGDSSRSGSAARHYRNGLLARIPLPTLDDPDAKKVEESVRKIVALHRSLTLSDERSPQFRGPWHPATNGLTSVRAIANQLLDFHEDLCCKIIELSGDVEEVSRRVYDLGTCACQELEQELGTHPDFLPPATGFLPESLWDAYAAPIEEVIDNEVRVSGGSRSLTKKSFYASRRLELLAGISRVHPRSIVLQRRVRNVLPPGWVAQTCKSILSYAVGVVLGRWDIRQIFATNGDDLDIDVFRPIQWSTWIMLCSDSEVTGIEEHSNVRLGSNGIVTGGNDWGLSHAVTGVLEVLFPNLAQTIVDEMNVQLGVAQLSDFLEHPDRYFANHLSLYSESRRFAPIYWPLSTPSSSYTLWLYYHRLTDQTLYTCINDFLDPKIRQLVDQSNGLLRKSERSAADEGELEQLTDFQRELTDFRDELLRIARFWKPNLNDGVQITAAPLWRLFQHRPWQRKLKETWEKLEAEDYDWAHLAMSIWPARVVPKCVTDRSLAIAHDLEDLFWIEDAGRWRNLKEPDWEIEEQKRRRRSNARDRLRGALQTLAAQHTGMTAAAAYAELATGRWDDRPLAALVWPERVAEKCWSDAALAKKLNITVPARRTKATRKKFAQQLIDAGCPDLAEALAQAMQSTDQTIERFWQELDAGQHDHQPLALALWPDRVVDKCTEDVDLAQTHGIQRFFWIQHPTETWRRRLPVEQEVQNEVQRRSKQ